MLMAEMQGAERGSPEAMYTPGIRGDPPIIPALGDKEDPQSKLAS